MEEPPWLNPPENYSIAITGRAFNHLVENEHMKAVLF
jgi:hypothetical protein